MGVDYWGKFRPETKPADINMTIPIMLHSLYDKPTHATAIDRKFAVNAKIVDGVLTFVEYEDWSPEKVLRKSAFARTLSEDMS